MSRIYVLSVMVALHVLVPAVHTEHQVGVCRLGFCKCTPAPHPVWTTINCTLPHDQKLDILEGDLPESTTELTVMGGDAVMFAANCLSNLKDINNIRIIGTKILLMRKFTAVDLNVISVYLEVEKCDVLRIEERAFTNIKGPLSVSIKHCEYVSLESEAFSWLLSMSISYVGKLELGQGAFMLNPKAANVDEHGPGLTIDMKNITVPEMPAQTFGSSAASITMQSVDVYAVRQSAFSANTYNIVMAVNCSFHLIEADSFTQKSLIYNLQFYGCRIQQLASSALRSAVSNLNISYSSFGMIETGAINATVASAVILDSEFGIFKERGFVLSSWNTLQMERNSFEDLASHAIVAPGANVHELVFSENEIENLKPKSLEFIGQAQAHYGNIVYKSNYYAQPCHCNITPWIAEALGTNSGETYTSESYCTVEEIFARCFNVPEQNMQFQKFLDGVCGEEKTIKCEPFKVRGNNSSVTEIKNPRFPHRSKYSDSLTDRNKKVIGIIIVTALGCVIIVMFISLIRWMRRRGHCGKVKNLLLSSNSSCGTLCDKFCLCGTSNGLDNARSISRLSVNEYSERHRLNEPRVQDTNHETILTQPLTEEIIPSEDKTTQTLPEELTKELLENLREKLEDPEHYVEAREMIEHLYELIKVEESCNSNSPAVMNVEENIYELPFQNTTPRIGKNKKQMISIGTRTPSLDKLLPLSPYNRQTALAHEYFEPKDFAVHLYAEIANCEKDKKALMNAMPDIVAEQAVPRGPYLRAVREKVSKPSQASTSSSTPSGKSLISPTVSPQHASTIKSNKSTTSNSSGKMLNRPLPEKPAALDPGEGTSFKHG